MKQSLLNCRFRITSPPVMAQSKNITPSGILYDGTPQSPIGNAYNGAMLANPNKTRRLCAMLIQKHDSFLGNVAFRYLSA
jgi:hypothetical protein